MKAPSLKANMDVTALAAVVLVLVVNMMIFAPPADEGTGSAVALPEARHAATKRDAKTETVLSIDSRGHFYVNAYPVTEEDLVPRVQRALESTSNPAVYVQADKDANYAAVMRAMEALRAAHIDDVALITAREPGTR